MTRVLDLTAVSRMNRLSMALGAAFAMFTVPLQGAAQTGQAPTAASSAAAKGPVAAQPSSGGGTVNDCLSAHRDSQQFRNQAKLVESNELLQICSRDLCPAPVRRDCQRWANEVTSQIPSVKFLLSADDGEPSRFVKVFVNDALMFNVLPARAVQFNPGKYRLRFVTDGKPAVEHEIILDVGDQDKEVSIDFDQPPPAKPAPTPAPVAARLPSGKPAVLAPAPAPVESRPVPLATYLFAGLGVAATINFAAWGISSKSLTSDLEGRCSPNCPQDEVDSARLRAAIADISLGVGVASFATATVFYFLRPTTLSPVNVDVGMLPRGGWAATVRVSAF